MKVLIATCLFLITGTVAAQNIQLQTGDTALHPVIGEDPTRTIHAIKLLLQLSGKAPDSTIKVPLKESQHRSSKVKATLTTAALTLQPRDWPSAHTDTSIEKVIDFQTSPAKSFTTDESVYISLDSIAGNTTVKVATCEDCNYHIRITNEGAYSPNKPFWIEVGANLDLIDGLEANNFFSGVFFYKRDIRPLFYSRNKPKSDNLGIFAGVYESKTISNTSESDFSLRQYYDRNSLPLMRNDSIGIFMDSGKIKFTQVVKNIGLFFSPQVRLTNGSANADGLHLSLSLWLELQWQRLSSTQDYTGLSRIDTLYVPKSQLTMYEAKEEKREADVRSHYFGIGLPVFFKQDNTNVFFNPVIGYSNQPRKQVIDELLAAKMPFMEKREWDPFYIFQFRLNEEKYGITFTGEVRGLLVKNSPPFVSLALTKKFDLTKFIEFK